LVRSFEGGAGGVGLFVDFSPDGQSVLFNLIATSQIVQFPVDIDTLIESTCDRVLRDLTEEERRIFGVGDMPTCTKFSQEQ
jgi:hypothetical protein